MPAFSNIVINDGLGTPVAHTFAPDSDKSGAEYADRVSGVPVGFGRITIRVKKPQGAATTHRVHMKIETPILETVSAQNAQGYVAQPRVAYKPMCNIEFTIPAQSVLQNRKDLLAYAKNLLANSLTTSLVENLEDIY